MVIIIMIIMLIMIIPCKVNAGLQANKGGKSLVIVSADNFFIGIRNMENQYGTLGKNANLDSTTFLDSTKNGIDCHMALNTEFGTAGILAYSEFGSVPQNSNNDTTTGNASGIYQLSYGNYEYITGIYSSTGDYLKVISNSDSRYYNRYPSEKSIPGDGMGKLGASASYPRSSGSPTFVRSGSGCLYSKSYNYSTYMDQWYGTGAGSHDISSRAVVVCGEGL